MSDRDRILDYIRDHAPDRAHAVPTADISTAIYGADYRHGKRSAIDKLLKLEKYDLVHAAEIYPGQPRRGKVWWLA